MKIKTFRIRLDDANLDHDEQVINCFMETITVRKSATEFVSGSNSYWSVLVFYDAEKNTKQDSIMSGAKHKISFPADTPLNDKETAILAGLKSWRYDQSVKTSMPGYMICHNSELVTIAKTKPKNLEDLAKIKGFSNQKILKYGEDVLALLNSI